jgi:hypothetical protein
MVLLDNILCEGLSTMPLLDITFEVHNKIEQEGLSIQGFKRN